MSQVGADTVITLNGADILTLKNINEGTLAADDFAFRLNSDRCHSMTSLARSSSVGGTVRPRAFAALRLTTSSPFKACWMGNSAGFSPLRMRRQ